MQMCKYHENNNYVYCTTSTTFQRQVTNVTNISNNTNATIHHNHKTIVTSPHERRKHSPYNQRRRNNNHTHCVRRANILKSVRPMIIIHTTSTLDHLNLIGDTRPTRLRNIRRDFFNSIILENYINSFTSRHFVRIGDRIKMYTRFTT